MSLTELRTVGSFALLARTSLNCEHTIKIKYYERTSYESCNQTTSDNTNVIVDGHLVYAQLGYNIMAL